MERTVRALKYCQYIDNDKLEKLLCERSDFMFEMSKRWKDAGIAALVTPCFPTCAFKSEDADDMGVLFDYTFLWNNLTYPSGTFPVTTIKEDEQSYEDQYNDGLTYFLKKTMENSKGMPIGIQITSHSYEDEKCLAVM